MVPDPLVCRDVLDPKLRVNVRSTAILARLAAPLCLLALAAPAASQLAEQQPPAITVADSAKHSPEVPIALELSLIHI